MEVLPGRPAENAARICSHIDDARQAGMDMVAFPEMAVPGYLLGDEWERPAFLRECERCGERIRSESKGIVVVFGNVGIDWRKRNEDGRVRKYNALFIAADGRFVGPEGGVYPFVTKTLMPNYREFDDSRHFYDTRKLAAELGRDVRELIAPVPLRGFRIGAILCEDGWDIDYTLSPLRILAGKNIDFVINASCSPFTVNKNTKRHRVFAAGASILKRAVFYVNNTGIQDNGKTVFCFDGSSCAYDGWGNRVDGPAAFQEGCLDVQAPVRGAEPFGKPVAPADDDIGLVARAIEYGTRQFMKACGVERVVIGASGGIDSCLVAAIYSRIIPAGDLLLLNMPSCYNSATTIGIARLLADRLGCRYAEIPIEAAVNLTMSQVDGLDIGGGRRLRLADVMMENVQARDRSSRLLAAVAAAFGGVFTCNANKSEMTVGYTTLYGDLGGYLANIGDLWKGDVYAMARHMNQGVFGREIIPVGAFTVVPSAELSVAQAVDEGKGDPLVYPYHDCLFRSWVEAWNRATPEEILDWYLAGTLEQHIGYEGKVADQFRTARAFVEDLERWWNQYQGLGVAKRIQAPPVLAVKRRAFGFDHREAQIGPRYTQRYAELRACVLGGEQR